MRSTILAGALGSILSATLTTAEIPHPELLPTTQALHDTIAKTPDSEPAAMKTYDQQVKRVEGGSFTMVPIAGGEYLEGSPNSETLRKPDEGPQRKISIEPFWMGKLEITWDLYRPFMENGQSRNKDGTLNRDSDQTTSESPQVQGTETLNDTITQPTPPYVPMHFQMGDGYSKDYPAVGMTQHAASQFCKWLSEQTGNFYRLPTEAEWEYACRAGTTTTYSFGEDPAQLGDYAWYSSNSEYQYQKVGTKKPNPWGLYDMHGNVSEHVIDQYLPDAYTKNLPWQPPVNRYPTVVRGGNWNVDPADLRSAARTPSHPAWKIQDPQIPKSIWYFTDAPWLGFRVVRPLKTPTAEEMHRFWNTGPGESE